VVHYEQKKVEVIKSEEPLKLKRVFWKEVVEKSYNDRPVAEKRHKGRDGKRRDPFCFWKRREGTKRS